MFCRCKSNRDDKLEYIVKAIRYDILPYTMFILFANIEAPWSFIYTLKREDFFINLFN